MSPRKNSFLTVYAARRDRRGSGALPFRPVFLRLALRGNREQSEADCAAMLVEDGDDLASLKVARAEQLEEIAADMEKLRCLDHRIAELETGR